MVMLINVFTSNVSVLAEAIRASEEVVQASDAAPKNAPDAEPAAKPSNESAASAAGQDAEPARTGSKATSDQPEPTPETASDQPEPTIVQYGRPKSPGRSAKRDTPTY